MEVEEVLPMDVKRLRKLLDDRGIGRLEIKKRAVDLDPAQLRRKLQLKGEREAVLVVAAVGRAVMAVVGRRV